MEETQETKMHFSQRAVWRNGGSNSAESVVRTRTKAARRTFSVSRRCAKPPSRWLQGVESVVEKALRPEKKLHLKTLCRKEPTENVEQPEKVVRMSEKTSTAGFGSGNSMNRQVFPKWLIVWWWIAIISAAPLYLRLLWEQTLLTWTTGEQMVGFSLIHTHPGLFLTGLVADILVFVWVLIAGTYLFAKKKRLAKSTIYYLAIPLVAFVLGLIPYNFWLYLGGIKF